jgi:hypothetical protein
MSGGRRLAYWAYTVVQFQPGETVMPPIKITSFWYAIYKRL